MPVCQVKSILLHIIVAISTIVGTLGTDLTAEFQKVADVLK